MRSFALVPFVAALLAIPVHAQQPAAMPTVSVPLTGPVYIVTHVDIIGGQDGVTAAIKLLHDFKVASLKEPGAVRFEVLQQGSRFNHFVMLETWQSHEAFEAHNGSANTRQFREKIAAYLGSPFDMREHALLP